MRIDPSSIASIRSERPVPASADGQKSSTNAEPAGESRGARGDSVQISSAGQSLAGRSERVMGELDDQRVSELRARVLGGAYDALDMVDEVARRILARGEL